jgi:hypothetical protein
MTEIIRRVVAAGGLLDSVAIVQGRLGREGVDEL